MAGASPWAFGWEAIVALTTLLLAGATTYLARRTSAMASKTADLAKFTSTMASETANLARFTEQDVALASTAIAADVRPVLIGVPAGQFTNTVEQFTTRMPGGGPVRQSPDRATVYVQEVEGGILFVSVPFRNEGVGIALVVAPMLIAQGRHVTGGGEVTVRQVPPHEFTRAQFGIPAGHNTPTLETVAGGFAIEVRYSDLAGGRWVSRLDWEPDGNDWRLTSSEVRADEQIVWPGAA